MNIAEGLIYLGFDPIKDFTCQNDGDGVYLKEWKSDKSQPSDEQITQAILDAEAKETATEYQRNRAAEYPPMADQLDKIFHEGLDAWKAEIQAIKDKYPKPE